MKRQPKKQTGNESVRGRNKKKDVKLGRVGNMRQASLSLNVAYDEIKRAKSAGCKAYKNNNQIDLDELRAWFVENPKPESAESVEDYKSWNIQLTKVKAQREEIKLLKERKEVISIDVVKTWISDILGDRFTRQITQMIRRDLPSMLDGKGADEIAALLDTEIPRIFDNTIQALIDEVDKGEEDLEREDD